MPKKRLTKSQKKKLKQSFLIISIILIVGILSYYRGKDQSNIDQAKQDLGIEKNMGNRLGIKPKPLNNASNINNNNDAQKPETFWEKGYDSIESPSPIIDTLPKGLDFWTPVSLWEDNFTYSDIKWLEIKIWNWSSQDINCTNVTDFLSEKLNVWFYWNTCRPFLSGEDSITFYVVQANKEKTEYIYEKHYILYKKWIYGTMELASGIPANPDSISLDIQSQNAELKEQNPEAWGSKFLILTIVDNLFRKISEK